MSSSSNRRGAAMGGAFYPKRLLACPPPAAAVTGPRRTPLPQAVRELGDDPVAQHVHHLEDRLVDRVVVGDAGGEAAVQLVDRLLASYAPPRSRSWRATSASTSRGSCPRRARRSLRATTSARTSASSAGSIAGRPRALSSASTSTGSRPR